MKKIIGLIVIFSCMLILSGFTNYIALAGNKPGYVILNAALDAVPVTVTADAQTKVYGSADPVLTFTSSDPAATFTGSLSRTAGTNVGTYAIDQGSLVATGDYIISSYVGANLNITPKAVTVTANAQTKEYGSADPALTFTSSDSAATLTGSLIRVTGEPVGNYSINQGSLALVDTTNYTLSYVGANFSIIPKEVTVTAYAKNKVFGSVDPALTYNSSFSAATLTGSLSRVTGETVGDYPINQGSLALDDTTNYILYYVGANFSITATPATAVPPTPTATEQPSYYTPLLNLTGYSYDTSSSYAGGSFALDSVFSNRGQQRAYNVIITYSSNNLTSLTNGGVSILSSLGAGESTSTIQYFSVSNSINSSPAVITVKVDYKNEKGVSFTQSFSVSIIVSGYGTYYTPTPEGKPRIVVSNYKSSVDPLEPGSTFILSMDLLNRGLLSAHNVTMKIGSSISESSTTASSPIDENFMPIGSSNLQVLGTIGTQQTIQVQQIFVVNSATSPGVFPLTIGLSYSDEDGNEFSDNQIITLLVHLVPSIEISFYEDPGPLSIGEKSTLPIQVVNLASSSILLGNISIAVENATLANNKTFIGNLESGGSFTIDTDITPEKAGNYPVEITVNYQDNFKKSQKITQTLSISVKNQNSANPTQIGLTAGTLTSRGQNTGSNQGLTQGSGGFWNIVLRFIRGMIGFDSSSTTNNRMINGPTMN